MGYRQEILIQLYKILENNNTDARIYYRMADKCTRSSLKYFFKKLSLQKRIFCRRIRYEIRELEKDIEAVEGNLGLQNQITPDLSFSGTPVLKADVKTLIAYCDKRETQYIELYKNLLSRTNFGNIREMLLYQKHSVQLVLNEIKTLENKIHKNRNEGEINYS